MPRVAIIGTGLIGASVGLALKEQGWNTIGWDPSPEALEHAEERHAVDSTATSISEAIVGADLVLIAGPLDGNLATLRGLNTEALVTDVTSVKVPLVSATPPGLRFVGGHPMAGREHAGPGAASPALFRGAPWVICNDGASAHDVGQLAAIVASIGANPIVMSAERHDQVVASVSHLPHLLAVALVNIISENPDAEELVSGSFRDLTRVASAEATWWPEVLTTNAEAVTRAIDDLVVYLEDLKTRVTSGDTAGLAERLERARSRRGAMAPHVTLVEVILQDKP
ncbi:MAG: prephenate dehydrogenase/arogenate dehydrogenase family protein, partial [Actinomycetota bacterium]|nr:prephenate dehydrogenase/arogenate dehydrogenase family protein [Actinomycetota bacterium]